METIHLIILVIGVLLGAGLHYLINRYNANRSTHTIINTALTQSLSQSHTDGFIVVNHQGEILHTNKAIEQIFAYQASQLLGQHIKVLLPEIETDKLSSLVDSERQIQANANNQQMINISLSSNKIQIAKNHYYLFLIRDISNEVQMYRQILHQRNKFEILFDNCPDGIIYTDNQHHVLDANIQFLNLYGQSIDEVLGQKITNLYQSQTPELNHVRDLLVRSNENWDQESQLAQLNCHDQRQITVLISHQQVYQNKENHYIYVLRDISQELTLISRIVEKNQTQELSEALVKMGYWRYDVKQSSLWCSNQIFQLLRLEKRHGNLLAITQLNRLLDEAHQMKAKDEITACMSHFHPLSLSLPIQINHQENSETRHIIVKGICETSFGKLNAIYGVAQDITEQLAQEKNLRLALKRLEQSQAFSNIGNWHIDLASKHINFSKLAASMFGDTHLVGQQSLEQTFHLIHPDDREQVKQAINRCINQLEKFSIEFRLENPKHHIRWLHQQGDVIRDEHNNAVTMMGVIQDISERKRKESELELFKQIIESSDHAVMVFDKANQLIYANPAQNQMHLIDKNQPSTNYRFDDFFQSTLPATIESKLTKQTDWSGETVAKRIDGSQFPVHLSFNQFDHPASHQQYRFAISYDISEQIKQTQILNQAKIDAEAANRAKSDFLSSMSHELRTPLNAVLGFSQLLIRHKDIKNNERIKDNVEAIYSAGDHLLTLINGILDLARIESGNIAPVLDNISISEVIDEAVDMVTPQAQEQGLCLHTPEGSKIPILYCQHKVPIVYSDFVIIKQALLNYLSNGIKYNKPQGMVFITIDINISNKTMKITVSDSGIGIASDKLDKVFTPFNRLGQETTEIQGSGIGLAITKKNIENLGGKVGVTSEIDKGSSFWLELPYIELKPFISRNGKPAYNQQGHRTVLYIEDNQSSLTLIRGFFKNINNVKLICANTTELATIYVAEYQPKLVFIGANIIAKKQIDSQKIKMQSSFYDGILISVGSSKPILNSAHTNILEFDEHLSEPVNFDNLQVILNKYKVTPSSDE